MAWPSCLFRVFRGSASLFRVIRVIRGSSVWRYWPLSRLTAGRKTFRRDNFWKIARSEVDSGPDKRKILHGSKRNARTPVAARPLFILPCRANWFDKAFLFNTLFQAMTVGFDLQGHRGARGLRPENTLAAFEAALDCGVTSIETDVRGTKDGVIVLYHDCRLTPSLCRPVGMADTVAPLPTSTIGELPLAELRRWIVDRNPIPADFPDQVAAAPQLGASFAKRRGMHAYAIPTLAELFAFIDAYAGAEGASSGKTPAQRASAARVILDLEVKRLPFFEDEAAARRTEDALLETVRTASWVGRCRIRSFDHRAVARLLRAEPQLIGGVLVAGTAPLQPAGLAIATGAALYCPDYRFLDGEQVRAVHEAGRRVVPWTPNDPEEWRRLLAWGVDGITTDYPDRLAQFLKV